MLNFIKKWLRADRQSNAKDDYLARVRSENEFFTECENVHDLPDIFHYWSNKYLAPELQSFGFKTPIDLFEQNLAAHSRLNSPRIVRALSIGAGNCDVEAGLAARLLQDGVDNFVITCLDINPDMIERGREHAAALSAPDLDVTGHIDFLCADFNSWDGEGGPWDVVIANQSLHHVLELEHLLDAVHDSMADDGLFLISDMIGRNGHMRWPEALEAMQPFWDELPTSYRYNQLMSRHEDTYINHDCSTSGFEGIRAQDILPLLCERFGFRLFFPYGNIIFPFVDRCFGHNFQAESDWDRDFIDRVHARDEELMTAGVIKPTSLMAVAVKGEAEPRLRNPRLTPELCVRDPSD